MRKYIAHLLQRSREVILDCSLRNGAIVAANSDHMRYPKNAKDYRFVWPRDAAYILYAAELLGIAKIREPFLSWLLERAEGFSKTGLLFQRYASNGAKDAFDGLQYQPDQAGALLWVLSSQGTFSAKTKRVVNLLAGGLYKSWNTSHFTRAIHDLWEEERILPNQKGNFSYTLASCSFGLGLLAKKTGNAEWAKASAEMQEVLKHRGASYLKECGQKQKKRIDASVLGLVWPFSVVSKNSKLESSLAQIKERLLSREGVHRYEKDRYDGSISNGKTGKSGAGGWPLLTFWYIIALSKLGRKQEASELFLQYSKNFRDYIPEQLFADKAKQSVSPLAWSHAMFVAASYELGFSL